MFGFTLIRCVTQEEPSSRRPSLVSNFFPLESIPMFIVELFGLKPVGFVSYRWSFKLIFTHADTHTRLSDFIKKRMK